MRSRSLVLTTSLACSAFWLANCGSKSDDTGDNQSPATSSSDSNTAAVPASTPAAAATTPAASSSIPHPVTPPPKPSTTTPAPTPTQSNTSMGGGSNGGGPNLPNAGGGPSGGGGNTPVPGASTGPMTTSSGSAGGAPSTPATSGPDMSGGAGGGAEMSMGGAGGSEDPAPAGGGEFKLMTTSFTDGDVLPDKFTCAVLSGLGPGAIPELSWGDPPEGTKSFGLTFVDTKIAPTSPAMGYHWAMYDIPLAAREIPEGEIPTPMGDLSGAQEYSPISGGFLGPCPTMGPDDYAFTLYALDVDKLPNPPKNVQQISDLMEMHMIAKTALTCTSNAKAGSAQ